MSRPTVTVMITTRNRAPDLARTLAVLRELTPPPDEIIVTLDGCTDGSAELLHTHFPSVRVIEHTPGRGSIVSRDRMLREAQSDLILSLDDDSYPIERDFLARSAVLFAAPEIAVVTYPQRSDEYPSSLTQDDFGPDLWVGSFTSSGAMLRRTTYLTLRGYAICFGHAYEEPDYALQCIAAGHLVRFHAGLTIRHHYSGLNRNERRTHAQHSRNEQWSILLRCPSPWWPLLAVRRAAGQFAYAGRRGVGWVAREPAWWVATLRGVRSAWAARAPVSWTAYRRWLKLLRAPELVSGVASIAR